MKKIKSINFFIKYSWIVENIQISSMVNCICEILLRQCVIIWYYHIFSFWNNYKQ